MPVCDGVTATKEIRKLEAACGPDRILIIAVTASRMAGLAVREFMKIPSLL